VARLTVQTTEEWTPIADPWCVGVLDRSVEELSATYGWSWDHVDEEGLGPMAYAHLAWDGQPIPAQRA
jgi:hypothetical protein